MTIEESRGRRKEVSSIFLAKRSSLFPLVVILLLLGLTANCGGPEEKKMKFFNKGKGLYEKGDFVKAELEFKNAVQIDPKFADGHYMLGMVSLKKGNIRGAYGSFSKAVELSPDHLGAQVQLGRVFLGAGQPDKAMEKAELVLKQKPTHEEAPASERRVSAGQKGGRVRRSAS